MILSTTPTAVTARLGRPVAVVVLALFAALAVPDAGHAAGTGGIEVTPLPSMQDGRAVTTFRVDVPAGGTREVPFTVSNVVDEPRSATVYVARLTRSSEGDFAVDETTPSPYVSMPQQVVTLAAGEVRESSFAVSAPDGERPDEQSYAAVVVEVQQGSVVTRASTLIYLEPGGGVSLPLLLVVVAVVLVVLAGVAFAAVARRRTRED